MQTNPSFTAEFVCAQRAAETVRPPESRLLHDPYARYFLRRPMFQVALATNLLTRISASAYDRLQPGYHAIVTLRQRYWEDVLRQSLAVGIDQIVNLGAGYDTTPMRLDLGAAKFYEVDAPPTQEARRRVMERNGLAADSSVVFVPCDFERESAATALRRAGFDPARPSLFLWYGVVFFLEPTVALQALAEVADLASPGSRLLFDYMDDSVINGTTDCVGARRARRGVAKRGEPYRFGLNPESARTMLEQAGFSLCEHHRTVELARRYAPDGTWFRVDDFHGIVLAAVT
jgi:methyltransferase (TIGR00027 family)